LVTKKNLSNKIVYANSRYANYSMYMLLFIFSFAVLSLTRAKKYLIIQVIVSMLILCLVLWLCEYINMQNPWIGHWIFCWRPCSWWKWHGSGLCQNYSWWSWKVNHWQTRVLQTWPGKYFI